MKRLKLASDNVNGSLRAVKRPRVKLVNTLEGNGALITYITFGIGHLLD